MKTKDGFIQGYNAQAAVDATAQVIVAHGLDAKQSDQHQLEPIADAIQTNRQEAHAAVGGRRLCSDANLRRWRSAKSTPISRRGGQHAGKEKAAAPRRHAGKNQGRRA